MLLILVRKLIQVTALLTHLLIVVSVSFLCILATVCSFVLWLTYFAVHDALSICLDHELFLQLQLIPHRAQSLWVVIFDLQLFLWLELVPYPEHSLPQLLFLDQPLLQSQFPPNKNVVHLPCEDHWHKLILVLM